MFSVRGGKVWNLFVKQDPDLKLQIDSGSVIHDPPL